jgi:hypothetical protein
MVIKAVIAIENQTGGVMMTETKASQLTVAIWTVAIFLASVALLLILLIQGREACAEGKKVSGTTESVAPLAQDRIDIPDELIFIHFRIQLWVLRSADPDWDNARAFAIRFDHPTKITWFKGYIATTHPGGDQTFTRFEGKEESLGGEAIYEAKGRYIGGTGKFKGIIGTSAFKQRWTLAETTTQWETEYEVKGQRQ